MAKSDRPLGAVNFNPNINVDLGIDGMFISVFLGLCAGGILQSCMTETAHGKAIAVLADRFDAQEKMSEAKKQLQEVSEKQGLHCEPIDKKK